MKIQLNNNVHCSCCNSDIPKKEWNTYNPDYTLTSDLMVKTLNIGIDDSLNFLPICPRCGLVELPTGGKISYQEYAEIARDRVAHPIYQQVVNSDLPLLYKKFRLAAALASDLDLGNPWFFAYLLIKLADIIEVYDLDNLDIVDLKFRVCLAKASITLQDYINNSIEEIEDSDYASFIIIMIDNYRRAQLLTDANTLIEFIRTPPRKPNEATINMINNEENWIKSNDFTKHEFLY